MASRVTATQASEYRFMLNFSFEPRSAVFSVALQIISKCDISQCDMKVKGRLSKDRQVKDLQAEDRQLEDRQLEDRPLPSAALHILLALSESDLHGYGI